jgi:hypothetical protein
VVAAASNQSEFAMKPRQDALRRLRERDTDYNSPIAKFNLIKEHGVELRDLGYDVQTMSCAELREALRRHGVEQ